MSLLISNRHSFCLDVPCRDSKEKRNFDIHCKPCFFFFFFLPLFAALRKNPMPATIKRTNSIRDSSEPEVRLEVFNS